MNAYSAQKQAQNRCQHIENFSYLPYIESITRVPRQTVLPFGVRERVVHVTLTMCKRVPNLRTRKKYALVKRALAHGRVDFRRKSIWLSADPFRDFGRSHASRL